MKSFVDENLGLDFTSPKVKNLKEIIKIIKEKELNDENCGKLLYIISEKLDFGKNVYKDKLDKKIDKIYFNINEEKQIKNSENEDENINNENYDKNNNIISNLSSDDLSIEKLDNKDKNKIINSLEFDNLLYNLLENNYDNNFTINSDIRNDPIFIQGILSQTNL